MTALMESWTERTETRNDEWKPAGRHDFQPGAPCAARAWFAASGARMGRVHVLICEPERWSAEWLCRALKSQEYEVCGVARDGVEALSMARTTFPDVVLTSLRPGRLDGVTLTRRLCEALPTPVIVMAGPRDGLRLREALAAGAVGYLVRPFAAERLRPVIDGAMRIFAERAAFYAARGPLMAPDGGLPGPGGDGGCDLVALARHLLMRQNHLTEDEALDRLFGLSRSHLETLEEAAREVVRTHGGRP